MSNETIKLLHAHHSVRSYADTPVDDVVLNEIIEAAHRGPTSFNSQQVSVVVTRDSAKRAKIAEYAGGQPWIAKAPVFITVVADMNKTRMGVAAAGKKQAVHESVEGFLAGAVDAGITLGNIMVAARAFGLGVVPIGGFRRNIQGMVELLHLPQLTFPVCGVCIGHIEADASIKPRLPLSTFRHDEVYSDASYAKDIAAYDETLRAYWKKINRPDGQPWSESLAGAYSTVYFPNVKGDAAKQGFLNDK